MSEKNFTVKGNIVDIFERRIFPGSVTVKDGKIFSIEEDSNTYDTFLMPGFVDAHVHVESSMLIPSEFARIAVTHGTVSTVSDPHEIGNVLGVDGIRYMINNGNKVPFKFYFGASSCVPATSFETAGAEITADDIRELFEKDGLHYLSEMMNYPGVLFDDDMVMEKIKIAKEFGKPIDGHAPGLRGMDAEKYISAGISTDHECFTLDEALDKLRYGMKIIIREGSAAKNFEALHPIIKDFPDMVMFCSDDKHPDDLILGMMDRVAARAVDKGYDVFDVIRCATFNPVTHYNLNTGLLRAGDPADFIEVKDLNEFKVIKTYIDGELVAENGKSLIPRIVESVVNNFNTDKKNICDFEIKGDDNQMIRVIEALEGQLITNEIHAPLKSADGNLLPDIENDILKITVVERYLSGKPSDTLGILYLNLKVLNTPFGRDPIDSLQVLYNNWTLTGITSAANEVVSGYKLFQNYPNPFNPKTVINYELQITGYDFVNLKVFDVLGNEVATLVNEKQNSGSYTVDFDGSNFPSGMYYYKMEVNGILKDVKRMVLLK